MRMVVVAVCTVLPACNLVFPLEAPSEMPVEETTIHLTFDDVDPFQDLDGHVVTCHGVCPTVVAGRIGSQAMMFTGTQCLDIAAPEVQPSSFTISLWVNLPDVVSGANELFGLAFERETSDANVFETFVSGNQISATLNGATTGSTEVAANSWHHVAVTVDDLLTLFVDGSLMGRVATTPPVYGRDPFELGCDTDMGNDDGFLTGAIDDLRFYDHVLAAPELTSLSEM